MRQHYEVDFETTATIYSQLFIDNKKYNQRSVLCLDNIMGCGVMSCVCVVVFPFGSTVKKWSYGTLQQGGTVMI